MRPEILNQVADSIEHDIVACEKLFHLLVHERGLLAERAFELLDLIIQEKSDWLIKLEHSARQRHTWLVESGLNTQADPAAAFLKWLQENQHETLGERWEILKDQLAKCQDANEINGKLIHRGQATHQKLIGILRGQNHQTLLYTGKGIKKAAGYAEPIGKA
ncbi:MAG: hypothetical protein RL497_529 [Pseudomonadota bacterium]|jgi:flagella synthesis protein FlgN